MAFSSLRPHRHPLPDRPHGGGDCEAQNSDDSIMLAENNTTQNQSRQASHSAESQHNGNKTRCRDLM